VTGEDEPGVRHHGRVFGEPLRNLFYDAQVFALPSVREPFGVVFLEAMWSKAVCIGTSIEAIPEIIKNGETGFLFEPNDHRRLAQLLISLFDSPEALERMAEQAYVIAKGHWRWDRVASAILARSGAIEHQESD
jgi:glycosyltransferase involved in cell wall biosynthesis